jgi:hypothetical protein
MVAEKLRKQRVVLLVDPLLRSEVVKSYKKASHRERNKKIAV